MKLPTKPIRRTAIKRKSRSKAEKLRIYGPPGYVEWIHEQACVTCGVVGFSEVAHIQTGGTGRKDDWTRTVALCGEHDWRAFLTGCHPLLHTIGRESFEAKYRISLDQQAERTQKGWLEAHPEKEEK